MSADSQDVFNNTKPQDTKKKAKTKYSQNLGDSKVLEHVHK